MSVTATAQLSIRHADSTPLKGIYCSGDGDIALKGIPSGGTFSGCGVFQRNGTWYFNPAQVSPNTGGRNCELKYYLGNDSVSRTIVAFGFKILISKDFVSCSDSFVLFGEVNVVGSFGISWSGPGVYKYNSGSKLVYATLPPGTRGTYIYTAIDQNGSGCALSDSLVVEVGRSGTLDLSFKGYADSIRMTSGPLTLVTEASRNYRMIRWEPAKLFPDQTAFDQTITVNNWTFVQAFAQADDGCVDMASLTIRVWPAHIGEQEAEDSRLRLFPNPANDRINVCAPAASTLHVYDLTGKVLLHRRMMKECETLDIRGFSPGAYFVRATSGAGYTYPVQFIKVVE